MTYLVRWCTSERVFIPGWRVRETADGKYFFPPEVTTQSKSVGSSAQFKVVSDGGDFWNCHTWDGTTAGSSIVKVAKPVRLRCILPSASPAGGAQASRVVRGITYTYTYTPVSSGGVVIYYTRGVSGSDGTAETDYVIEDALVGDVIFAAPFSTLSPATLSDTKWIDLNVDGRAWAAQ